MEQDQHTHSEEGGKTIRVPLLAPRPRGGKEADEPPGIVVGPDGLARPAWAERNAALRRYYDEEWGVPITEDIPMFRMLSLLILQAGLHWGAALERADHLDDLFHGFDPRQLVAYTDEDEDRLLADPGMIRNRRKVRAILNNGRVLTEAVRQRDLAEIVWSFRPLTTPVPSSAKEIPRESSESAQLAKTLRKTGFTFVGPRICYSLFQCAGIVDANLLGTHRRGASGLWNEDGSVRGRLPIEWSAAF